MEVTITNIIQLKYFVCVAASGSFSEAAELMFSTQSTVSKQIFSLEKDLNAQLFDRSKRKIVLTSQGKAVLRNAQIMLDDYNNMLSELAQLNAYDDSTVRIKSTPVLIPYNILTLLANFRKLNPWVKMQVEEFEEQDILKLLREDECDLAFIRVGKFDEELFERIVIYTERVVLAVSKDHRLANRACVSLAELALENFMLLQKGSGLYRTCLENCRIAGFEPNVVYTGNRMANIFEMISKDIGISLMLQRAASITAAEFGGDNVAFIPLEETITVDIALARFKKRHHNTAATALWKYVEKNVQL